MCRMYQNACTYVTSCLLQALLLTTGMHANSHARMHRSVLNLLFSVQFVCMPMVRCKWSSINYFGLSNSLRMHGSRTHTSLISLFQKILYFLYSHWWNVTLVLNVEPKVLGDISLTTEAPLVVSPSEDRLLVRSVCKPNQTRLFYNAIFRKQGVAYNLNLLANLQTCNWEHALSTEIFINILIQKLFPILYANFFNCFLKF